MNKQFELDLHRINLILDGKSNRDHISVKKYLNDNLSEKDAKACIYFLTQTSLGDFVNPEIKKNFNKGFYTINDNEYNVEIDTVLKQIKVSKNFRNSCISDYMDEFLLDFSELNISYDMNKNMLIYYWDYDISVENSSPVVIENEFKIEEN